MIKLSKAEAQRIQAEHIEWYGRTYGLERVRALVMAADRSHLLTDGEHDIVIINRFVPRGGAIENLIPEIREREVGASEHDCVASSPETMVAAMAHLRRRNPMNTTEQRRSTSLPAKVARDDTQVP